MFTTIKQSCDTRWRQFLLPLFVLCGVLFTTSFLLQHLRANETSVAAVYTSPARIAVHEGLFTITIMVESKIPVNTFAGTVHFDPSFLAVEALNYSSSIANLWVSAPSFDNEAGTIEYIGGTTQPGGVVGSGVLFTVTFRAHTSGVTTVGLAEATMLQSDGYGTPVDLAPLTNTVVTISPDPLSQSTPLPSTVPTVETQPEPTKSNPLDLNEDGKVSFSDIGVFLEYYATKDARGDVNNDGVIDENDLKLFLIL